VKINLIIGFIIIGFISCKQKEEMKGGTYGEDYKFLSGYIDDLVELSSSNGISKVLVSPGFQGRVLTSTSSGSDGTSYGWLNYKLISSKEQLKQFNPIGGEERFWLGPEGGQYSLYFPKGKDFVIDNWQVPAIIDTETFELKEISLSSATFTKNASIVNYSGNQFDLSIERKISLLNPLQLEIELRTGLPEGVQFVAFESVNTLKNSGKNDWNMEGGLPSIWLLGMFNPSEKTIVLIPFKNEPDARDLITTNYFGEIPSDRISILDSVLYFTCDGKYRSKLGVAPSVAKPIAASFDFDRNILTLIKFEIDPDAPYVNSKWELQKNPYSGDVVNSYNDGPLENGSQMGPFYELESSSPALELKAGEGFTYRQVTCHFEGKFEKLNELAIQILGVDLSTIKK
jgi:hypothetical protein